MSSKDTNTETTKVETDGKHHLRSSDPDLKVVLDSGKDQVTKWYYAPSLANKSKYIDTMLSTPMKESDTRTITFPDITQEFWDAAIEFIDNPVAARRMEASDVLNVAKFYDKYEFVDGTNLCDCVLLDHFEHLGVDETKLSVDVDLLIDLVVIAHETNLSRAARVGVMYIWGKLRLPREPPYNRTMFTESHLEKVLPAMLHELSGAAWPGGGPLYNPGYPFPNLDEPDFPKVFARVSIQQTEEALLHSCIKHIKLSDVECVVNGRRYDIGGTCKKGTVISGRCYEYVSTGGMVNFKIRKMLYDEVHFQGWAIVVLIDDEVEEICWVAPCSTALNFPPKRGWKKWKKSESDSLFESEEKKHLTPTITYILNKEA